MFVSRQVLSGGGRRLALVYEWNWTGAIRGRYQANGLRHLPGWPWGPIEMIVDVEEGGVLNLAISWC